MPIFIPCFFTGIHVSQFTATWILFWANISTHFKLLELQQVPENTALDMQWNFPLTMSTFAQNGDLADEDKVGIGEKRRRFVGRQGLSVTLPCDNSVVKESVSNNGDTIVVWKFGKFENYAET